MTAVLPFGLIRIGASRATEMQGLLLHGRIILHRSSQLILNILSGLEHAMLVRRRSKNRLIQSREWPKTIKLSF